MTTPKMKNLMGSAREVALILAISLTVGVSWNHTMLLKAWRGEQIGAVAAGEVGDPMPLGLAQVKEFFDAKEAVLVDARDAESFASGHLKGAVSLPLGKAQLKQERPFPTKLPWEAVIVVYCNGFSCHDSMDLGKILMKAGYRNVYVYEGGFPEWRDAGYPVETGGA